MSDMQAASSSNVRIIDLDVPFGRLVLFFVKAGFALIPALFLIWAVLALAAVVFGGPFGIGFVEHGRMMRW
jgi:hypothetical protein